MRSAIPLVLTAALAAAQQPDPAKGPNFYSIEKEVALGKALADNVLRQARVLDDAAIAEYVSGVAQNLWRYAGSEIPLTVIILDDQSYNSSALPGGFLFVNSGLLERTDTEAELAAVLSHQLAHIAARHGTRQDTQAQVASVGSTPVIFMGGWTGYEIRQSAQVPVPMGYLSFARGFEHDADRLGLQYLDQAGYDRNAYVAFLDKLQAMEPASPGPVSQLRSMFPPTEERIDRTREAIASLAPQANPVINTPEFDAMKARLTAAQNNR